MVSASALVMATFLVTGANRGIGLEYCRQLQGRGDAVVVGVDELAFAPDEGCRFLAPDVAAGRIDADTASVIVERVDGWPAGLQLARLVIRDRETAEEVLAALRGGFDIYNNSD